MAIVKTTTLAAHYRNYLENLDRHFWDYQNSRFPNATNLFERHVSNPHVFAHRQAAKNVLVKPGGTGQEHQTVLDTIPLGKRHVWFGSMMSSQALAQSVFGNLIAYGKIGLLAGIPAEDGEGPAFFESGEWKAQLEFKVDYLRERRSSSIDVMFASGDRRVAVECKLAEVEVGACSQVRGKKCMGQCVRPAQSARAASAGAPSAPAGADAWPSEAPSCPPTVSSVRYWQYMPGVFHWPDEPADHTCPIYQPYQLVRNVLAACVRNDGQVLPADSHAVLLYDDRNPQASAGGKIYEAYQSVRTAAPGLMRRCSWQTVLGEMRHDRELSWLADELAAKYGL